MADSFSQHVFLGASDGTAALAPAIDAGTPDPYGHLPPLTKSQVQYWRELAGVLNLHGSAGVRDDEWPEDLAPPRPTLRAMMERGILARRQRAWHLRRDWYRRLTDLKLRAVPTPPLKPAERPAPDLPTYAELHAWEAICRWLDGQPQQRARLPFTGLDTFAGEEMAPGQLPTGHLRTMRKERLLRHTSGCEWVLSASWRDRLQALWRGMERARRETAPLAETRPLPRSLVAGIDTWYLNWRTEEEELPVRLRRDLDDYQGQAKDEEQEVETRWVYDGAPLRMYRSGTKPQTGKGVSWSYVLVNPSLRLLIRRKPLGGIVAQARLGSECLWRLTERRALDELDALIRRLWCQQRGRWQVSQVHLAHDVAHAPIEEEQLERVVSRSRTQATYAAAKADLDALLRDLHGEEGEDVPYLLDWDALYAEDTPGWDGWEDEEVDAHEEAPAEDRALTVHRWGKRLSGVTWSPGGATSFVEYDKVLESHRRGTRTMEPLWRAAGWDGAAPVTRFEARLRRAPLRELKLPGMERACLDDPWEFLQHKLDVWVAMVGRAEENCPEAVNVAWIRQVVREDGDSNRSRWETDPTWKVVQEAPFADAPAAARRLVRRKQRLKEVRVLDADVYGLLVSRVALLHPQGETWDLSRAVGDALPALAVLAARPEKDFGALVRMRRQARGLPVCRADRVLPLLASRHVQEQREYLEALDGDPPEAEQAREVWRLRLAERRMREAFAALEDAERRAMPPPPRELAQLEAAFYRTTATYDAAYERIGDSRLVSRCGEHP